jgi:hypothetical protein
MRGLWIATLALGLAVSPAAVGLELQESCVKPPPTVTDISGVNTQNAQAQARYTMPDIIQSCGEGYPFQGTKSAEECTAIR